MDLASLGIRVTTQGAKEAATDLDKLGASGKRVEKETAKVAPAMARTAKSAKELQFATRGLPAQFTDIATSLASGQRPLNVLLQQGGQLKDMFGGVGPAFRAMGTYALGLINPVTLAAGAVALLGYAWKNASDESNAFNKALILTGNYAATSAEELENMAARVEAATSATQNAAASVVAQVAATGRFTASQIESVSKAALNMRDATGQAVEDTIKQFVRLADEPALAIETLNKSQHLLTDETKKQVKALQDQGREAEAAALAITSAADALNSRSRKVTDNLTGWALLWRDVRLASSGAFNVILKGLQDSDTAAKQALRSTSAFLATFNATAGLAAGVYAKLFSARSAAAAKSGRFANVISNADTVSGDFARTRGLPEDFGLNVAPPGKEADAGNARVKLYHDTARAVRQATAAVRDYKGEERDLQAVLDELDRQRFDAIEGWDDLTAMLNGPLAEAEREHAKRMMEIQTLGEMAGKTADQIVAAKQRETAAYNAVTAAIREQQFAMANPERMQVMEDFRRSASDTLTDLVTGAKSAKDAIKDFFDSLAESITRAIANRWIEQLFGASGTSGQGTSGGNFLQSILGAMFGGGRAMGGPVLAGQYYEVGERNKPEILSMHGRSWLIPGNDGRVDPVKGGGEFSQTNVIQVQGVIDSRTALQIARESAIKTRSAMRRNG